jgi:purine-nucleoside phosphorylase
MTDKVLITAAYRGELDQLGDLPPNWVAEPCGIGGVAAAAGLAMLMTMHQPGRIIVLGTCGALGRGLSIGSLVAPKIVRWVDPGVLNGTAHIPPNVYKPMQIAPWPGLPPAVCLQTPSITLAADHATRLATMSEAGMPAVEHLELYSMAFVANTFGVPITAILGVTNAVGPTGHRDWVANHKHVEKLIQEAVFKHERPSKPAPSPLDGPEIRPHIESAPKPGPRPGAKPAQGPTQARPQSNGAPAAGPGQPPPRKWLSGDN